MKIRWNKGMKIVCFLALSFSLLATGEIREIEMIGAHENKAIPEKVVTEAVVSRSKRTSRYRRNHGGGSTRRGR